MITDPLLKFGPDRQLELFKELVPHCQNHTPQHVVGASLNLAINAIRQTHETWRDAEKTWDVEMGRHKQLLKDHYDFISGRRKGIFPYDQVIVMPQIEVKM